MKISLIITSLNSALYIERAILSFLAQDYNDKELIIVDGKSTDSSHSIIESFQKKYPKQIKWITEPDTGISNARNIAIKYVTGDIVGFLGADDILHKDFFEKIPYYISIKPNADVLYFDSYSIRNGASSYSRSSSIAFTKRNLIKHCPLASGESFYYAKRIFDTFTFNEKNKYTMDYELNLALASSKNKIYNFFGIAISAVLNISDGDNISVKMSKSQKIETAAVQLKYTKSATEKIRLFLRRPKFFIKNLFMIRKNLVTID